MAGKKRELNNAQSVALGDVRAAREAQHRFKVSRRAELMEQLRQEGLQVEMTTALAVRRAYSLGVPIARIGRDGLGTSDPGTPRKLLDKTDPELVVNDEAQFFTWADDEHTQIRVALRGFVDEWEHLEQQLSDWPEIFEGLVERDPRGADDSARRSGWIVLIPDDEVASDPWFIRMVEERSGTGKQGDTLPVLLNKWVEDNS